MFFVSDRKTDAPKQYQTAVQEYAYRALNSLGIPFERVETDEAITMADCVMIEKKLDMQMVKTLFLCNRQQTEYYVFVTAGDKPFRAKEFSNALGIPRVSFAPAEKMKDILGTQVGAATVFSALLPSARDVRFVFDKEIADREMYGCSDGTTTGYMKVGVQKILEELLPSAGVVPTVIEVQRG